MENNQEVNELVVNLEEENVGDKTTVEELEIEDAIGSKRQRKRTSHVWEEFIELKDANGIELVQCIHCKTNIAKQKTGTTTQMIRHLRGCFKRSGSVSLKQTTLMISPPTPGSESLSCVQAWKYDPTKVRELTLWTRIGSCKNEF
ncbi:putative Zinc finger, BED-type [Corchorus olitorius]|uniref:Zinc finger, BED-type n=1 Tax=Corchorus olitorius TaxID=93759 RepID=A0A1R3GX50_9ROSI|nr:putative Zinc finger, BED-type [Corchorus olitorius]